LEARVLVVDGGVIAGAGATTVVKAEDGAFSSEG